MRQGYRKLFNAKRNAETEVQVKVGRGTVTYVLLGAEGNKGEMTAPIVCVYCGKFLPTLHTLENSRSPSEGEAGIPRGGGGYDVRIDKTLI
jgi:hypothetical protein